MDLQERCIQLDRTHSFNNYLLEFRQTNYPNIFRNPAVELTKRDGKPLLIVFNSVTASGKDTIMNALISAGVGVKAKTATTRDKRPNEPDDYYVWMRKQTNTESFEQYVNALRLEYSLLEVDAHHGNVYGLPERSLIEASKHGVVLLQNEPNGAKTLVEQLSDDFLVVVLFVVPDSWQQIYERMTRKHESRDNLETRLDDSLRWMEQEKHIAHFIVHNTEQTSMNALAKKSLAVLIQNLRDLLNSLSQ